MEIPADGAAGSNDGPRVAGDEIGLGYPKRENGNLGKALEVTYHQGDECCSYLYFPSPAG
jgi:hypothetical protein